MPIKKRSVAMESNNDEMTEPMSALPEFGSGMMRQQSRRTSVMSWLLPIIIVIVVIGLYIGGMMMGWWGKSNLKAVFLVNGQVYFGKISRETSRDIYLNNVYYIQLQDQEQPGATSTDPTKTVQVPTLLKRGEELHRPYGDMRINREQVVAIENVGNDSPIAQQIQQLNSAKK